MTLNLLRLAALIIVLGLAVWAVWRWWPERVCTDDETFPREKSGVRVVGRGEGKKVA